MQTPVDYPVNDDSVAGSLNGPITYAALLELHDAQQKITEDMIQSAARSMEAAQHLPFATTPEFIVSPVTPKARSADILTRLLKAIR